jgi:hypothetical protein
MCNIYVKLNRISVFLHNTRTADLRMLHRHVSIVTNGNISTLIDRNQIKKRIINVTVGTIYNSWIYYNKLGNECNSGHIGLAVRCSG